MDKLLTINDLCEYLSVRRSTLYEWTHTGFIPCYKILKDIRFKQSEIDLASGGGSADRNRFLQMLEDADKRKFDLVLVWALDRLSREGISNTLGYLDRLNRNGIALKSLQESWLDTRDESLGQLLIAIFSWVAAQERLRISERTRAGLKKAISNGKPIGMDSTLTQKFPTQVKRVLNFLLKF